ncbi:MAG: inositol monophosphatase family protein, partial [Anaerolineae bacterium]
MKKILLGVACLLSFEMQAIEDKQQLENDQSFPAYVNNLWDEQLKDAKEIAKEAGKKILEIRNAGYLTSKDIVLENGKKIRQTNADIQASQYIIDELSKNYPTYGFLSQDHMDKDPNWYMKDSVWMINPIDGTKEFEKGSDDFHVQIGLLRGDEAILGVSYYPATDAYVWAVKDQGAWCEITGVKQKLVAGPSSEKILLKSSSYKVIESHFEEWKWDAVQVDDEALSSTSRLLKMIEGKACLYISLGASAAGTEKKGGVWNYGANVVIANESGLILKTL